jgi:hypothetical protein
MIAALNKQILYSLDEVLLKKTHSEYLKKKAPVFERIHHQCLSKFPLSVLGAV